MKDEEERHRISAMLAYERDLWAAGKTYIAGIDEAGRGPLAGPVVAAAVIFPKSVYIPGVNDSKKLKASRREEVKEQIDSEALAVGIGIVHEGEIDRINILQATYIAMRKAVGCLSVQPQHLLIDGMPLPDKIYPQTAVIKGDQVCFSIAAASIIAKVTRDRMMEEYHEMFPEYGFDKHKGYGTKQHVATIRTHGLCPIHRRSFKIKGWSG